MEMEGWVEMTGRRKQLLDDLEERTGYCKLKIRNIMAHCVQNSLWKRLWTCRKIDYGVNELDLLSTLRDECRMWVFENKVLRRIFGPKRDEVTGEWKDCITRRFMLCTPHQISFG
jgi:hypothetical protein